MYILDVRAYSLTPNNAFRNFSKYVQQNSIDYHDLFHALTIAFQNEPYKANIVQVALVTGYGKYNWHVHFGSKDDYTQFMLRWS